MSRYNPCGAPVDIGRRPYRTRARLYPDSEQEFEIEWSEARPDVPFLRGPNALCNLEWVGDREDYWPTSVGEIFGASRTFRYAKPNPLAVGGHVCGTPEDFAGNGKIDWLSPPVQYRPDGLPECCGAPPVLAGGLVLDSSATVSYSGPYPGYGGAVLDGSAIVTQIRTGTGGVMLGGSAIAGHLTPEVGTGGAVLGGSAWAGPIVVGSGGVVLGGAGYSGWWTLCPHAGSCAGTTPSQMDWWCGATQTDEPEVWVRWDTVIGTTYRFTLDTDPVAGYEWWLYAGPDCGSQAELRHRFSWEGNWVQEFEAPSDRVWFRLKWLLLWTDFMRYQLKPLPPV